MRSTPAPANAPLRSDGTKPPNMLSVKAVKAAATKRSMAPSPNALPRADGTTPTDALSEAATKGAAGGAATKRSTPAPANALPLSDGTTPPNVAVAAMTKRAETMRSMAPSPNALPRADGTMPPNALSEVATKRAATFRLRASGLSRGPQAAEREKRRREARIRQLPILEEALQRENALRAPPNAVRVERTSKLSHANPNSPWMYKFLDRAYGPYSLSQILQFYYSRQLTADTLVRPFGALYHQPFVTIEKMVACGWKYPGPAEG